MAYANVNRASRGGFGANGHQIGSGADQLAGQLASSGEGQAYRRPLGGERRQSRREGELQVRKAAPGCGALLPDRDYAIARDEGRAPGPLFEDAEVRADAYQSPGEPAPTDVQRHLALRLRQVDEETGPGRFAGRLIAQRTFPGSGPGSLRGPFVGRPSGKGRHDAVAATVPLHARQN